MNYIRELLYRPKRSDKSLMARFYFADLNLNAVAAELDSFDGRKDPERCSCLVNKLRSCQDKLLSICNKMLEEIEPGLYLRSREFRAKFPDDIMTDNLAGQLWFGAECLAAGSSIMNKERESESMRPLAKAVTKSLDKVRSLLREQCLSPQPEYTEKIRENIKIFDRLFAEFEFNYVQCMVHVKTVKEYDLHQDLIVLFSETLMRAIKNEMISQEMVDLYEPTLMFAIPRLAIVYGLFHSPEGPLNVDRSSSDFPDLFLPFKNLLRKIRELLLTLAPHEVLVLEMLLCQHEEPANVTSKLKEVEQMLANQEKSQEGRAQAEKLQEKLCDDDVIADRSRSAERKEIGEAVAKSVVEDVISGAMNQVKDRATTIEIDCTGPEIQVTPRHKDQRESQSRSSRERTNEQHLVSDIGSSVRASASASSSKSPQSHQASAGYSPRPKQKLKRHNAKRDTKRLPLRYQKDRRARFKSTEDLLHRLYVCISGAADQLQSNYAGDFRTILKCVFLMNASVEESDDEDENEIDEEEHNNREISATDEIEGASGTADSTSRNATESTSEVIRNGLGERFQVDMGTDALQHQLSEHLRQTHLRSSHSEQDDGESSTPGNSSTYAQNLDMQLQEQDDVLPVNFGNPNGERSFYQPEPTLMDIASGSPEALSPPAEIVARDPELALGSPTTPGSSYVGSPPPWVPDAHAPNCMGCGDAFTLFKRRHHCRSCGLVFCNRCSSHSLALPHYGIDRPVRVCNRCHVIYQNSDMNIMARTPDNAPFLDQPSGSSGSGNLSRSPWSRNFGMVS